MQINYKKNFNKMGANNNAYIRSTIQFSVFIFGCFPNENSKKNEKG